MRSRWWCVLWLTVSGVSMAQASPSTDPLRRARQIVERYVDATGGRAALEADSVVRRKGQVVTSGMDGTWEEWRVGSDHVLRVEKLGMLRQKRGLDGTTGWSTDFTSKKVGP